MPFRFGKDFSSHLVILLNGATFVEQARTNSFSSVKLGMSVRYHMAYLISLFSVELVICCINWKSKVLFFG